MTNVFDDEKKKNEKAEEAKNDANEKALIKAEKEKEKKLATEKAVSEKDALKNAEKDRLKAEGRAELEAEIAEAINKSSKERNAMIEKIRSKKTKSAEEGEILRRLMMERAKENAKRDNDLEKLMPSQMTLEEMLGYCKKNEISFEKGENTVILRARISAFRNPGKSERLQMLAGKPLEGKIIR